MRVTSFTTAAVLLLAEVTASKEILYMPRGVRRRTLDDRMRKAAFDVLDDQLQRRQSNAGELDPTSSTTPDMNATIAAACIDGLSGITSVSNQAGVTACYNILSQDREQKVFQADLRLYSAGQANGPFASLEPGNMLVGLTYPDSTNFTRSMKRSIRYVPRQTSSMSEMQQYSLQLNLVPEMDLTKLNDTELLSLITPQISINGVNTDDQTPISTNISSTDMAYFVIGEFSGQFKDEVTSPQLQQIAIEASSDFILPGTTLGIFPTGLIVTLAWMVLFLVAYGAGTVGRLRHRKFYRARKAAVGGRIGKRF